MKKKLLSLVLAVCLIVPCTFALSACDNANSSTVYTVSESEWEINFNITKVNAQTHSQTVACSLLNDAKTQDVLNTVAQSLDEITSYTLSAIGTDYQDGTLNGSGVLKVAPNGLDMKFYLEGVLQEEQTKTIPNTDLQYIGLKTMLTSYFLFSGKYNLFTFDTTKNAYVAENLTVTVISEDDISKTYDLYNKAVEVTFINGYLNTISVEFCDKTFEAETVYQTFVFTFSDINNTTVTLAN